MPHPGSGDQHPEQFPFEHLCGRSVFSAPRTDRRGHAVRRGVRLRPIFASVARPAIEIEALTSVSRPFPKLSVPANEEFARLEYSPLMLLRPAGYVETDLVHWT